MGRVIGAVIALAAASLLSTMPAQAQAQQGQTGYVMFAAPNGNLACLGVQDGVVTSVYCDGAQSKWTLLTSDDNVVKLALGDGGPNSACLDVDTASYHPRRVNLFDCASGTSTNLMWIWDGDGPIKLQSNSSCLPGSTDGFGGPVLIGGACSTWMMTTDVGWANTEITSKLDSLYVDPINIAVRLAAYPPNNRCADKALKFDRSNTNFSEMFELLLEARRSDSAVKLEITDCNGASGTIVGAGL